MAPPGVGVEQIISGDPEDLRESLVIFRHELGLRRLLADAHDLVDVLYGSKPFRPQLLGGRGFELGKARREMELDALCVQPSQPLNLLVLPWAVARCKFDKWCLKVSHKRRISVFLSCWTQNSNAL